MYEIITIVLLLLVSVKCASYNRYDTTDRYASQYTTINNLYNQNPYKTDIARFPANEPSRYPNYNPSGYTTKNYYNSGGNQFYSGDTTAGYGDKYGDKYGSGYTSYEYPFLRNDREYCVNRSPQNGIYVDNLMGMWYGVEYIQHLAGDSRVDYARTCIVMHLSEPLDEPSTENQLYHVQHINAKFRQEYRHIRLLWDESGRTTEYALYFRNDSAGYWQVADGQNGTMTRVEGYRQFSGTVQVLKAVNDHLLLNFCQEPIAGKPPQLYSVLFSRDPGLMPRWEITSVHTLLQNKRLSVASRRMVCGNNGDRVKYSVLFSFISCILAYCISLAS